MDLTLRDYLSKADDMHNQMFKFGIALSSDKLSANINTLRKYIKNIQAVSKRMADVSNIINHVLNIKNNKLNIQYVDPYQTTNDHAVLRTMYPSDKDKIQITEYTTLPIRTIESPSDIPISYLYYIKSHKQYAINIAGVIIKGTLGNIVDYKTTQSARCEYGIKCKSFEKNIKCQYYHDPEDYIKFGKDVPTIIRNFTVGSWMYSKNRKPKKYFTRHIGSLDTLDFDIKQLKRISFREEISTREGQLMHDLLIYMISHSHGLLERYPSWLE